MEWWVWVILVGVAIAAVFVFFEWRSWNKPLRKGLEDDAHGHHDHKQWGYQQHNASWDPSNPNATRHEDLRKPLD
jgi:hypothetical protein